MWKLTILLAVVLMPVCVCAATYTVTPGQSIQTAIDGASYGDTVQVAAGIYLENITLKNGVTLTGESKDNTIIDANSSGSVVTSIACDPNTVIEGFIITGGAGTMVDVWGFLYECGGGMCNNNSLPTINNCIFEANASADYGGGIYNFNNSKPTITNCDFLNNTAANQGGAAIYNESSSSIISDCLFDNNSTTSYGGAINNATTGEIVISNCTFTNNNADRGGGAIYSFGSTNRITDCTFDNNSTIYYGGAIYDYAQVNSVMSGCTFTANLAMGGGGYSGGDGSVISDCLFEGNSATYRGASYNESDGGALYIGGGAVVTNCTIKANLASRNGGAIFVWNDSTIANCAITGNSANNGGAIYNWSSTAKIVNCAIIGNSAGYQGGSIYNYDSSKPKISNTILWDGTAGNSGDEIYNHRFSTLSDPQFSYCNIEGSSQSGIGWNTDLGTDGGNNIDADPMFIDPDGPDDQYGTDDDNLHLLAGSPCIDAGTNQLVAADHSDLDSNGVTVEIIPFDLDGNIRFANDPDTADTGIYYIPGYGVVDMGPYEYPGLQYIEGDINHDGRVDMADLAIMAANWLAGT